MAVGATKTWMLRIQSRLLRLSQPRPVLAAASLRYDHVTTLSQSDGEKAEMGINGQISTAKKNLHA